MREQPPEIRENRSTATGASRIFGWLKHEDPKRLVLLATVPGLICAILGPLGSYEAPFTQRVLFWVPSMALGLLIGGSISYRAFSQPSNGSNHWLRVFLVSAATTIAMTVVVIIMGWLVFKSYGPQLNLELIFYVWVITLVMSAIAMLSEERNQRVEAARDASPDTTAQAPPPLRLRLPVRLQDQTVLALEAEDHYVRVHTAVGTELILIRLGDAVREMGTVTGARTHRSWWVAKSAVASIHRSEGRLTLQLTHGISVPVSRNYVAELKDAGWLDG